MWACCRRHPCKLWDHSHSMDVHPPLWLQKMASLTELVIDVPGAEHASHAPSLEAQQCRLHSNTTEFEQPACWALVSSSSAIVTRADPWLQPVTTEEVMAPLTGLSGLQCLRLSVPFWDCSWGWLRQLLRLTTILISDCGMLIVCVSCVPAVATHPTPGQRGQAQPSQWLHAGKLGCVHRYGY
jgi:hypothetical protein